MDEKEINILTLWSIFRAWKHKKLYITIYQAFYID